MRTIVRSLLLLAALPPGLVAAQAQHLSREPLDSALNYFCQITARDRNNAVAWFGVGSTQRALADGKFAVRPAECHTEGASYLTDAAIGFIRTLDVDPNYPAASDALADMVERNPVWGAGAMARNGFRRAASRRGGESARVLLLRARLEREGGERDSTLVLIDRYLAAGGDSGVALFERARERFYRGESRAALEDYWAAVARSQSLPAHLMLRRNLALVALPGEIAEFDMTMSIDRPAWVGRFWTRRDVEAGLGPGGRLIEHYRRYEVSRNAFRPVGLGLYADTTTIAQRTSRAMFVHPDSAAGGGGSAGDDSGEPTIDHLYGYGSLLLGGDLNASEFDVRGQAYIRHGEPDDLAGDFWLYRRDGQTLIVRVNDSRFGSACNLSPKYCAYEGRRVPPEVQRRWNREWAGAAAQLASTDEYIQQFKRVLHPAVRLYGFPRTEQTRARLLVTLAVPAGELTSTPTNEGVAYHLKIAVMVMPPTGEYRAGIDTTRTFVSPQTLRDNQYVQATELLELDPGPYTGRLTLTSVDGKAGVVLADDSLDLGDGTQQLSLSDLVLGKESSGFSWWSGKTKVYFNPLGTISRKEPLRLYYLVGGLVEGTAYSSEVQLFRSVGKSRKVALRLTYSDNAEGSFAETERIIGLDRLEPGPYTIEVTIRGVGGLQETREGVLVITD